MGIVMDTKGKDEAATMVKEIVRDAMVGDNGSSNPTVDLATSQGLTTVKVDRRRGPRNTKPYAKIVPDTAPTNDDLLMIHAITHGWKATWYKDAAFMGWVWQGPQGTILLIPGEDYAPRMTKALREALEK